jgi:hypothetical protein
MRGIVGITAAEPSKYRFVGTQIHNNIYLLVSDDHTPANKSCTMLRRDGGGSLFISASTSQHLNTKVIGHYLGHAVFVTLILLVVSCQTNFDFAAAQLDDK